LITIDGEFEDDSTYGSQIKITRRMWVLIDDKPPYLSVSLTKNVKLLNENVFSRNYEWISSYFLNLD